MIAGVRDSFLDEGVDEQVLQEMKTVWTKKLLESKAVEPTIDPVESQQPPIVANNPPKSKVSATNALHSIEKTTMIFKHFLFFSQTELNQNLDHRKMQLNVNRINLRQMLARQQHHQMHRTNKFQPPKIMQMQQIVQQMPIHQMVKNHQLDPHHKVAAEVEQINSHRQQMHLHQLSLAWIQIG